MAAKKARGLVIVGIIVVIILIIGSWYIRTRNTLVTMEEQIDAAWSEVDNQLQRRSDLIPNLVATVKGFAAHEEEVFTRIAEARSKLAGAGTVEEKAAGSAELESALSRLLVVVESYPELKANENFIRLQDELAGTENRLTVARKRYNDSVKEFNTRIRMFPGSMVAGAMGFEKKPYFEISQEAREAPKVSF